MRRFLITFVSLVALTFSFAFASNYDVFMAFQNKQSDVQVEGSGKVVRILKDEDFER